MRETTYEVTFVEREGDRRRGQTVSGDAKPLAAWLRAVADQLDPPPKRPARGGTITRLHIDEPPPRIIPVPVQGPMRS